MSVFSETLNRLCAHNGFDVPEDAMRSMETYYDCLVETNKQYNLTAIVEPEAAALKHFFDSIVPEGEIPGKSRVVDVGSGAGFPVVPLKILRGDISAFAVESSKKKCDFIVQGAQAARIDVTVMNVRAEELATGKPRESYDVCVSRAVAQLRVLMELCAPLLKDGGRFLAYKGDYEKELNEAAGAMKALNLKLDKVIDMPGGELAHHVLVFHKTGMIAQKYPRRYAQIVKSPL